MSHLVAIHQPNYLPWSGFFHKWMVADSLIILDTVQYHKNEWQNRNRIKGVNGAQWVTTPVHYHFGQAIGDVTIASGNWARKQISAIGQSYSNAPFFADYWAPLEQILQQAAAEKWRLARLNIAVIRLLGDQLGCTAPCLVASEMAETSNDPSQRLIDLCQQLGGDGYLSGAEGRNYLHQEMFIDQGINLYFQHVDVHAYPQLHGEFVSHLSVIDLLYNSGAQAGKIVRDMGVIDG
ncbi:MAG: WbqC family protein [Mariprofundales bacterium]